MFSAKHDPAANMRDEYPMFRAKGFIDISVLNFISDVGFIFTKVLKNRYLCASMKLTFSLSRAQSRTCSGYAEAGKGKKKFNFNNTPIIT